MFLCYNKPTKKCIIKASSSGQESFISGQSSQDSASLFDSNLINQNLIAIDQSGKYYSFN